MIDIQGSGTNNTHVKRNRTTGRSLLSKVNDRFTGITSSGAANVKVLPGRASMIDIAPLECVQEDVVGGVASKESTTTHEGPAHAPLAVATGVTGMHLGIRGSKLFGNDTEQSLPTPSAATHHPITALASLFGTTTNSVPSSERDDLRSGKDPDAGTGAESKPTRPNSALMSLFDTAETPLEKSQRNDQLSGKSRPNSAVVNRAPSAKLRRPASALAQDSTLQFNSEKDRIDRIMRPSSAVSVSDPSAPPARPHSALTSLFATAETPLEKSQRNDQLSGKSRPNSAVVNRAPSAKLRRPASALAQEPSNTTPYTSPHTTTFSSLLNALSPRLTSPPSSSSSTEALFTNDVEEAILSTTATLKPRVLSAQSTPGIATPTATGTATATATAPQNSNLLSSLFGMFIPRRDSLLPRITSVKEELSPASPAMQETADQLFQDDDVESITSPQHGEGRGQNHTTHGLAESRTEYRRASVKRSNKQPDTMTSPRSPGRTHTTYLYTYPITTAPPY